MAMDLSKSYEYFQPEKVEARINIVGCGSVGATLAENLVRLGITNLALWDMDVVNPHNLANQIFRQQDIGRFRCPSLIYPGKGSWKLSFSSHSQNDTGRCGKQ